MNKNSISKEEMASVVDRRSARKGAYMTAETVTGIWDVGLKVEGKFSSTPMTVKEFAEKHYSHKPDEYVTLACLATPDNPLVVLAKLPVGYVIGLAWIGRMYRIQADADLGDAVHTAIDAFIRANDDHGEDEDFDAEAAAADFWAEHRIRLHPALVAYQL